MKNILKLLSNLLKKISDLYLWQVFIKRPLSVKRGWAAALNRLSLGYIALSFITFIPFYFDAIDNPVPKSLSEMRVDVGILSDVTPPGRRSVGSFELKTDQGEYLDYSYLGDKLILYKGKRFKVYSKEEINMFGFKRSQLEPYQLVNVENGEVIKKFDYEVRFKGKQSNKKASMFFLYILALLTLRLFLKYWK